MAASKAEALMQDPTPMIPAGEEPQYAGPPPSVQSDALISRTSMLDTMKAKFAAEPRVKVKIRSDNGEPVSVQVNGYGFLIAPNEWVGVPESVATLLEEGGYI